MGGGWEALRRPREGLTCSPVSRYDAKEQPRQGSCELAVIEPYRTSQKGETNREPPPASGLDSPSVLPHPPASGIELPGEITDNSILVFIDRYQHEALFFEGSIFFPEGGDFRDESVHLRREDSEGGLKILVVGEELGEKGGNEAAGGFLVLGSGGLKLLEV